MPSPPITITIVPSRLALIAQGSLALGVAVLLGTYAPGGVGFLAALAMGGVMLEVARRRPAGELRVMPRAKVPPSWGWRAGPGGEWRDVRVHCDYLGPWLMGLRLDGRRLWLWADSSDDESMRRLRRVLLTRG